MKNTAKEKNIIKNQRKSKNWNYKNIRFKIQHMHYDIKCELFQRYEIVSWFWSQLALFCLWVFLKIQMKQILSNENSIYKMDPKKLGREGDCFIHAENKCNLLSSHCDFTKFLWISSLVCSTILNVSWMAISSNTF